MIHVKVRISSGSISVGFLSSLSGKSDHFLPWLRSTQGVVREVGIYADFNAGVSDQFHLVCVRVVVTRCLE